MFVGLFVGIWVARYLGTEQFGLLNYAQSLVMLFAAFANLGLDGIVIRKLVEDESKREVLLGTAFVLRLAGGFIVVLLLLVLSNFLYTDKIVFIFACGVLFQSFNVIDFYFQSKVLSRYVVIANIIALIVSSAIKIILIFVNAPLISFVWVVVLDTAISVAGLLYFYQKRNLFIQHWGFNWQKAIGLLHESWPLILAGMASMINMRMDQVLLGNMTTITVVGNYAAGIRIAEIWLVLPGVIGASIYPAIISAKQISENLYKKRVISTIKYMSFFALPFALFVTFLSSQIIHFLYGNQFSESAIYLSMYIWTGLPYVVFFALSQVCLIEKITKLSTYVTIWVVIFNIVLNFILIPKYGGVGAVSATLIVTYAGRLGVIILIQKRTKIFFKIDI